MSPSENPLCTSSVSVQDSQEEALPITSFACKWKAPCKRKESKAKIADISFKKHVYGHQTKHNFQFLSEYDPRPTEFRGKAQDGLQSFLYEVKGKGLGVSILFDPDCHVWKPATVTDTMIPIVSQLPSKEQLIERVKAFKESLKLTPESISIVVFCKTLSTHSIKLRTSFPYASYHFTGKILTTIFNQGN